MEDNTKRTTGADKTPSPSHEVEMEKWKEMQAAKHPTEYEQFKEQEGGTVLSVKASVAVTFLFGVIAVCIGIFLTSLIMKVGWYAANNSNITPIATANHLTETGGAIWAVFAPCLPYLLLGCVLTIVGRFSNKKAANPQIYAALVLCALTCIFHMYSPMLRELGEQADMKGLAESPRGFAVFYCVVGIVAMMVTSLLVGAVLFSHSPKKDTVF